MAIPSSASDSNPLTVYTIEKIIVVVIVVVVVVVMQPLHALYFHAAASCCWA